MLLFEQEQSLPRPVAEIFPFFADAANLESLTPPWLNFRIITPQPIAMAVGTEITYRLKLRRIPVRWVTEITVWDPPVRFVDEQRRGPYRTWIHEHKFVDRGDHTVVQDRVQYAVPGGAWVDRLCVRPDIETIFAYRRKQLEMRFGGA